ncbi:hypothetical protein NUU61_004551 [Penicillium alfredii]|uniref:Fatty acid hydroxylase domain-containing protein n=1 Tax=Penicillium alfredii TaxID=1506179 RepID=A0A9W9KDG7_9EURO|nr:uncharacterized protein NUU61_004551 [Penicillium alfredii]KAJ5102329.1 hypothetical protein NUU61_004551 [Penicillium alfredii]
MTMLLDTFWLELDNFAKLWQYVCTTYPYGLVESIVGTVVLTIGFVVPATMYLVMDQFPSFAKARKIQPWEKQPTPEKTRQAIIYSLLNYFYTCATVFGYHWLLGWRTSTYRFEPELPTPLGFVTEFACGIALREVIFYYIHRLLHHKWFFWIHQKHHEFNTPIGFAAIYCHPIEMLVQNGLPIALPLAICRGHFITQMLFATYAVWDATAAHSGYTFGRLPTPELHDLHHEKPLQHYGVVGFMDTLHGTDRSPMRPSRLK